MGPVTDYLHISRKEWENYYAVLEHLAKDASPAVVQNSHLIFLGLLAMFDDIRLTYDRAAALKSLVEKAHNNLITVPGFSGSIAEKKCVDLQEKLHNFLSYSPEDDFLRETC